MQLETLNSCIAASWRHDDVNTRRQSFIETQTCSLLMTFGWDETDSLGHSLFTVFQYPGRRRGEVTSLSSLHLAQSVIRRLLSCISIQNRNISSFLAGSIQCILTLPFICPSLQCIIIAATRLRSILNDRWFSALRSESINALICC